MSEKEVWKWFLPKLDDAILHHIYKSMDIVCKGFRVNSVKDVKQNRKRLISNLVSIKNYPKLMGWVKKVPPTIFEETTIGDKEINELTSLAIEYDAPSVFAKLFYESKESKAIQLFSFLKDQHPELLDISDGSIKSIVDGKADEPKEEPPEEPAPIQNENKKEQESTPLNNVHKKLNKLETKIQNLNKELEKRDKVHRNNLNETKENLNHVTQKLNEKNRVYNLLLKEKESIESKYKKEKNSWEKERLEYEENLASLQTKINDLQAQLLNVFTNPERAENQDLSTNETAPNSVFEPVIKSKILVIGKPAYTENFQSDQIDFVFIDSSDVHNYPFSAEYKAYWILLYELSSRDQFLLKNNDSFAAIEDKVEICKDFDDAMNKMHHYTTNEVRI